MDKLFENGTVILNKYKLEEAIGKGGFGAVYKATDLRLRRVVAIKTLLHGQTSLNDRYGIGTYEEFIHRFEREAEISSYFTQNPHVITVYGLEQDNENNYYLVLEYLEGGSLNEYLRKLAKPLPITTVYSIAKDICRALTDIHNHPADIIHRDLKPANILLRGNGQAVVADFGVAQIGRDSHRTELHSASSRHPGSPPYKSPEQESSYTYLTPASDLYSLGLIIYEMATGKLYKKFQILPPSKLNSAIPPVLDAIIEKLLRPNPLDRYREAADLLTHLEKAGQHQITPSQILGSPQPIPSDEANTGLLANPNELDSTEQSTLAQPGISLNLVSAPTPRVETQQPAPEPEPVPLSEPGVPQSEKEEKVAALVGRRKLLLIVLAIALFFGLVATVLAIALNTTSTKTVEPSPTSAATGTPAPTMTLAPTTLPLATATLAPTPIPTTATPEATNTVLPESTATNTPEATVTTLPPAPLVVEPLAAPTETPVPYVPPQPQPTRQPQPQPTPTPIPPTPTPQPTATPTLEPTIPATIPSGATPVNFPTAIPQPTATAAPPTATFIPIGPTPVTFPTPIPPPTSKPTIAPTPNFPTPIPPPTATKAIPPTPNFPTPIPPPTATKAIPPTPTA